MPVCPLHTHTHTHLGAQEEIDLMINEIDDDNNGEIDFDGECGSCRGVSVVACVACVACVV